MPSQREFLLYYIAILALSYACPELRIKEERVTSYDRMRKWDVGYPLVQASFDAVSKEFILLIKTQRFERRNEFVSFDRYELPGDNRLFFIIHIYNEKWEGGYSMYSRGQLTEAPSGYKVIATPSREKPLKIVSMCDDNVFELLRSADYGGKYYGVGGLGNFRLIKHRIGGKNSVLCASGSRFPKLRLTAIDSCARDTWRCWH